MKKLSTNWITEGVIDFEYKKYVLLAYLKYVKKAFFKQKLFPQLSELIDHYQNLITIRDNKKIASNTFPKEISKLDFEQFRIQYEQLDKHEDKAIQEIEEILNFSIPKIKTHVNDGKEIYDFVEEGIEISPIGIMPLNKEEGYMFINTDKNKDTSIYEFQITIFETAEEKHRAIRTNYITTFQKSLANTFETLKLDLLKEYKDFPNPATYLIHSHLDFPLEETLLPIAKRSLVRYISTST